MSVTVPLGAQGGAQSAPKHDRASAHETAPAVVYLAAARNTYGTLSYRRAMRRVAEQWPRAVVMDADALWLRVACRLVPALAVHP